MKLTVEQIKPVEQEEVLLPLAHHWEFWYNAADGLIYAGFILAAKILWHLIDFGQSVHTACAVNEQLRKRKQEQKKGGSNE